MCEDYRYYHKMEDYLRNNVRVWFQETGELREFEFFCIVAWKSNRSKSYIADRLLRFGHTDYQNAIDDIASAIHEAIAREEKMRILRKDWGFGLPIASAILSILYPAQFTIYDVRVCEELVDLGYDNFAPIKNIVHQNQWPDYERFMQAVRQATPVGISLREKDRWLWGRSFARQLEVDIDGRFPNRGE